MSNSIGSKGQIMPVAVVGGTLIDGNGGVPQPDAVVLIEDGRFSAVGKRGAVKVPPSATVIDAAGQFVLPGIMNGNVHLLDAIMMMGKGGAEYLARFEGHRYIGHVYPVLESAQFHPRITEEPHHELAFSIA